MASKREKGKIAHGEWPAIVARAKGGESLASIARSYGCTAPAIRYIVNREARAEKGTGAASLATPAIDMSPTALEPPSPAPIEPLREASGPSRATPIDRQLRERVNSDIAAFLVAFDAAFISDSASTRAALLEATDRLLRAGARTRIALERMSPDAERDPAGDIPDGRRQRSATGARGRG